MTHNAHINAHSNAAHLNRAISSSGNAGPCAGGNACIQQNGLFCACINIAAASNVHMPEMRRPRAALLAAAVSIIA